MYIHFRFLKGGNPWISFTNADLWRMIRKYDVYFEGVSLLVAEGETGKNEPKTYEEMKNHLRGFAQMWQMAMSDYVSSWSECISWGGFFQEYGQRFGLLREFHENGIC